MTFLVTCVASVPVRTNFSTFWPHQNNAAKAKNRRMGWGRKRLPANPMILKNIHQLVTFDFIPPIDSLSNSQLQITWWRILLPLKTKTHGYWFMESINLLPISKQCRLKLEEISIYLLALTYWIQHRLTKQVKKFPLIKI